MLSPPVPASPPRKRIALFLLLALLVATWAPAANAPQPPEPVIAIADVHGDFDHFVAILRRVGLINTQNHWTGGKTTLVQVGDLLDRGPMGREVMDLLMSLQKQAPPAGGQVVSLLGNHEMMNVMGDLRYVTAENYAHFADSHSEERRKSAYQEYLKWRERHPALLAELPQPVLAITESEWVARHPLGFIEHREAFGPNGVYGRWLRERTAVARIGGVIFLHGGIHPNFASLTVDAINRRIHEEINAFDAAKAYLLDQKLILPFFTLQEMSTVVQAELIAEHKSRVTSEQQRQARLTQFLQYGEWLSVRVDGPLWFRGYDQWSDEEGLSQVSKVLEAYNASHIVVGHTVQKGGRMRARFGGKVFLIDTGMLSSYYPGGQPSALEIREDTEFIAQYMDQNIVLLGGKTEPSPRENDRKPYQQTSAP